MSHTPGIALLGPQGQPPRPQRMRMGPDGRLVREKLAAGRVMKVVKLSGAVTSIPLYGARAGNRPNDPYRAMIENSKPTQGAIPYGRCPATLPIEIQLAWIPEHIRSRERCDVAADGRSPIDNAHACACIEELIKFRQQDQRDRMSKLEASAQTDASKAQQATIKLAEMLAEDRLRQLAQAQAQAPAPQPPTDKPTGPLTPAAKGR